MRVVHAEAVYMPLVLYAFCAGFPSYADNYVEGEIDLPQHLIAEWKADRVLWRAEAALVLRPTRRGLR